MASNVQNAASVKHQISKLFEEALRRSVPQELKVHPAIAPCKDATYGDYQCNNAMAIFSRVKGVTDLKSIGEAIIGNLPPSEMIELCSCAEDGYINIRLSNGWMENSIHRMLVHGIETWGLQLPIKTAVVDFSSPNIAKEMHVGHLRSTIIGDTLARMLEYANVNVLRRNHIGDWGTQFGMLIEFFFEKYPSMDVSSDQAIGDLEAFYKATKQRFDTDPIFKEKAQKAVVSLQSGEEKYRNAWTQICEISRRGYERVYQRLGVRLEEKGESFYNPYIPRTLKLLNEKGLVKESEGASVIFIERKKIPLIVVKRDGGYNYSSTDLAALWYRLNEEKAEWIIYVTDVCQREHFEMVFAAANKAGWLPEDKNKYLKATHVGFGLVMGEDGKRFRSRSTETVKLVDLLDEAKNRCKEALVQRGKAEEWTAEVLESTAEAVGYGAVKYADLKNNRTTNYTFNFDQMLSDKGNTAVYLQYAHARICSIILRSGKDVEELKKIGTVAFVHQDERALGLHLIRFSEASKETPNETLVRKHKTTQVFKVKRGESVRAGACRRGD